MRSPKRAAVADMSKRAKSRSGLQIADRMKLQDRLESNRITIDMQVQADPPLYE